MMSERKPGTKMKSLAAVTSCMFSYCVFLNTPEAAAFTQVKIPVRGVSSAIVSKSSLAAASGRHDATCTCGMCSVGRDLATAREEGNSHEASPVLSRAHGPGCPCNACSKTVRATRRHGCSYETCLQSAKVSPCVGCAKCSSSSL